MLKVDHDRKVKKTIGVPKEGCYITNSGIRIGNYHISDWRTRKKGCVIGHHSWGINHRRHVRGYNNGTAKNTSRANVEYQTNHLPKVSYDWKLKNSTIHKIKGSNLWVPEECIIVLWESGGGTEIKRVHNQTI